MRKTNVFCARFGKAGSEPCQEMISSHSTLARIPHFDCTVVAETSAFGLGNPAVSGRLRAGGAVAFDVYGV